MSRQGRAGRLIYYTRYLEHSALNIQGKSKHKSSGSIEYRSLSALHTADRVTNANLVLFLFFLLCSFSKDGPKTVPSEDSPQGPRNAAMAFWTGLAMPCPVSIYLLSLSLGVLLLPGEKRAPV